MEGKVIIVDDTEINRELLSVILGDTYKIEEFTDGTEVVDFLETGADEAAVILLDLMMPKMNGYQVLEYMRAKGYLDRIPVLIISAESSAGVERKCLEMGCADFIRKPFDAISVKNRVKNITELFSYKKSLEEQVGAQTNILRQQNKLLRKQAEKQHAMNEKIIELLGTVVEYRNLESGEHIKRVKGFTEILANCLSQDYPEYGLTKEKISVIVAASALHDIGKISITDSVLLKPGRLTDEEFAYMKTHTTMGCDILVQIEDSWEPDYRQACYDICRHHHERFDGRGYPDGLVGEAIPISAQIVSIADVYDALVSERCYKRAFDKETAFTMIQEGKCGTFSPKLLECFAKSKEQFEALAELYKSEAVVAG